MNKVVEAHDVTFDYKGLASLAPTCHVFRDLLDPQLGTYKGLIDDPMKFGSWESIDPAYIYYILHEALDATETEAMDIGDEVTIDIYRYRRYELIHTVTKKGITEINPFPDFTELKGCRTGVLVELLNFTPHAMFTIKTDDDASHVVDELHIVGAKVQLTGVPYDEGEKEFVLVPTWCLERLDSDSDWDSEDSEDEDNSEE